MLMRRSNISFSSIVKILLMDDFLPGRTFYWNYVLSPPLIDWVRWKQMKKETYMRLLYGGGGGEGETQEIGMLILIAYCIFFAFLFQSCLVESRVLQSSDFLQLFQWVLATMVYTPSCFLCIVMVSMNETSKDVSIEMLSHTGCNFQGYHCISVRVWQF